MARRSFEHMLFEELEMANYPPFQRWYAPSTVFYNFSDMSTDFRNVTRMNRYDLYGMDYFRQPYWMVDRSKISEIMSQYERRHQPVYSRDEGNLSRFRSSNNDMCQENVIIDPRLTNFKQVFESRNSPSSECTSNGAVPQTVYGSSACPLRVNSPSQFAKTTHLDWQGKMGNASDNSSSADTQSAVRSDFSSSYASWYCPEEQQQIVDMLKEVNLRHDRQLKRDLLLSKGEQQLSADSPLSNVDSEPATTPRKSSLSSSDDEDEDNINIILSPCPIPPIPEVSNEEEEEQRNTTCQEKSASDFYKEFQSIFTASPEKKIINEMTKGNFQNPLDVPDDDIPYPGRTITQEDKNAVKTVLDFDHMEDITEMPFHSNAVSSAPIEISAGEVECKVTEQTSENQITTSCENTMGIGKVDEVSKTLNPNIKTSSGSNQSSSYHTRSKQRKSSKKVQQNCSLDLSYTSQPDSAVHLENFVQSNITNNHLYQPEKLMKTNAKQLNNSTNLATPEVNHFTYSWNKKKENRSGTVTKKEISKQGRSGFSKENMYSNINKTEKSHYQLKLMKECLKSDRNSSTSEQTNSNIPNELRCLNPVLKNVQSCQKTINEIKCDSKKDIYSIKIHPASDNLETKDNRYSMSEPFLTHKRGDVVYKRISLSEIFDSADKTYGNEFQHIRARKNHKAHFLSEYANENNLSPSDHLKKILGIGEDYVKKCEEDNSVIGIKSNNKVTTPETKTTFPAYSYSKKSNSKVSQTTSSRNSNSKPLQNSHTKKYSPYINKSELPPSVSSLDPSKTQKKTFDKNKKSYKYNNYNSNLTNSSHDSSSEFIQSKGNNSAASANCVEKNSSIRQKNNTFISKTEKTKDHPAAKQCNDRNLKVQTDAVKIPEESIDETSHVLPNFAPTIGHESEFTENSTLLEGSKTEQSKTAKSLESSFKEHLRDTGCYISTVDCQEKTKNGKMHGEYGSSKEMKKEYSKIDKISKQKKTNLGEESNKQDGTSKVTNADKVGQHLSRRDSFKGICDKFGAKRKSPFRKREALHGKHRYSTPMQLIKNNFLTSNVTKTDVHCQRECYLGENQNRDLEIYFKGPMSSRIISYAMNDVQGNTYCFDKKDQNGETNRIQKGRTEKNTNRNYFLGERKQMSSNNSLSERINRKFQYSKQDFAKSNKSTDLNYSKNDNANSNNLMALKNSGVKHVQVAKCGKHEENISDIACSSASEKRVPLFNTCVSASGEDAKLPFEKLVDEVCETTAYNTTCRNEENKCPRMLKYDFFSGIQEDFTFMAITSELENSTQKMIEEAGKAVYCAEVPNIDVSSVRKRPFKLDKNPKNDLRLHQVSSKGKDLLPILSRESGYDNSPSCALEFEKIAKGRISAYPSNGMIENADGTAQRKNRTVPKRCCRMNDPVKTGKWKFINLSSGIEVVEKCKGKNLTSVCVSVPKAFVIVPSLNVMGSYSRSDKSLKMNPSLDIHVRFYLEDYFSQLCPIMSSLHFQSALQVHLSRIIAENLLHTLPFLLNILSFLSSSQIPWNRSFLKEILQRGCLSTGKVPENALRPRAKEEFQNYVNDVLNCWDILSGCLARGITV